MSHKSLSLDDDTSYVGASVTALIKNSASVCGAPVVLIGGRVVPRAPFPSAGLLHHLIFMAS